MGFYQRLKDLKEDADLTQKQVADLIGVSMNHYGKYERGETDIPLEKAIILAKYYGVSLDYLAGLTNEKKMPMDNEKVELYRSIMILRNFLTCHSWSSAEECILKMIQDQKK